MANNATAAKTSPAPKGPQAVEAAAQDAAPKTILTVSGKTRDLFLAVKARVEESISKKAGIPGFECKPGELFRMMLKSYSAQLGVVAPVEVDDE